MDTIKKILRKKMPQVLYHYTSVDSFLKIIESKKIFASQIQYLNDYKEFGLARKIALDELQIIRSKKSSNSIIIHLLDQMKNELYKTELINICVCSFSGERDLISQWNSYSGFSLGIAIGFESKKLQNLADRQKFFLAPCIYDIDKQRLIVRELIEMIVNEFCEKKGDLNKINHTKLSKIFNENSKKFIKQFSKYAPIIKSDSFSEEKEWRIISNQIEYTKLKYRIKLSLVVPYYEFELLNSEEIFELAEILIGPNPYKNLNSYSISQAACLADICNPGVINCSDIPYRNW